MISDHDWNNIALSRVSKVPDVYVDHGQELHYGVDGIVIKHYIPFSCASYYNGAPFGQIDLMNIRIYQFMKNFHQ